MEIEKQVKDVISEIVPFISMLFATGAIVAGLYWAVCASSPLLTWTAVSVAIAVLVICTRWLLSELDKPEETSQGKGIRRRSSISIESDV